MIPTEAVVIVAAMVGAAAGAMIGQAAHWRLEARRFARDAARVKAAPFDWERD